MGWVRDSLVRAGKRLSRQRTAHLCVAGKGRSDRFSVGVLQHADASDSRKNHLSPAANAQDWCLPITELLTVGTRGI